MAIEEPAFEVLEREYAFEVRQYRPVIVAETLVDGDMGAASNAGFRLIADYIFGNNRSMRPAAAGAAEKIAMTAPVTVEPASRSEKIAMTAPVIIEPRGDLAMTAMQAVRWRVQFVLPKTYSLASLPRPNNPAVTLREVAAKRYGVLGFSGLTGSTKVQQKVDELVVWLKSKNLEYIAAPQLARYNPPWTLPFLRRNEILVELIAR